MKKVLILIIVASIIVTLPACSDIGHDPVEAEGKLSDSSSNIIEDQNPAASTPIEDATVANPLFISEYIPVASSQGYFVVRSDSGNQYGLVDSEGNSILPCKYEKISFAETRSQTMLIVLSKGSYGVFDLNGNERIPCEYTEVSLSPYTDYCWVRNFLGKKGLLDLDGNIILPIEFDVLTVSYGKTYTTAKNVEGDNPAIITVYDSAFRPIKEIQWDKETILDIVVSNGGNLLCVNYGTTRYNIDYIAVEGSSVYGGTKVEGKRLFYFNGQDLVARNLDSQEEIVVWSFPDDQISEQSDIRTVDSHIDPITGDESVDLFVVEITADAPDGKGYYLRVTFGDTIGTIGYTTYDVVNKMNLGVSGWDNIGWFYNGLAIVFPQSGYIYTINTKGEKVADVTNPYTSRFKSYVLPYSAILNNNNYYYIINADGNIQLSGDGYSNIEEYKYNIGIYLVTNQEGEQGIISKYLEEIVPCGGIDSIDTAIEQPSYEEWNLEAKCEAEDELYVIHNGDKWALYDATECRLITDFTEIKKEGLEHYQQILGNGGYTLISESRDHIYLVSFDGTSYSLYSYLDLP